MLLGIDFVLIAPAYLTYLLAMIIPGPNMLLLLKIALTLGRLQAVSFAFGICSMSFAFSTASALGTVLVLELAPWIMDFIKIFALGFFLYLGAKSIFNAKKPLEIQANLYSRSLFKAYLLGIGSQMTNPKSLLFYLSLFSLLLDPNSTSNSDKIFLVLLIGMTSCIFHVFCAFVLSLRSIQDYYAKVKFFVDYCLGVLFIAIAIFLFI